MTTSTDEDSSPNPGSGCSLREAIKAANTNAAVGGCPAGDASGSDQITFAAAINGSPFLLTLGGFEITSSLNIVGNGVANTIVDGNHVIRPFLVAGSVVVELSGLTIRNGSAESGFESQGGGIKNHGTLTISDAAITGNRASASGGGIENDGSLMVVNSVFKGNTVPGGASFGGGIFNGGSMSVRGSTFEGNSAGGGGAIFNGVIGTGTITESLIDGNTDGGPGAGVVNGGVLTLTNSTVSGNTGAAIGTNGSLTVSNSSIISPAANAFSWYGGTILVRSTIVTGYCNAPLSSLGGNVGSDASCFANGGADLIVADVGLGSLADNGGPTRTHLLLPGSSAIDHGDNATCPAIDQRGQPRPRDGNGDGSATCDSGAYELQEPYLIVSSFDIQAGQAFTTSTTVTLNINAPAAATEMSFSNDGANWTDWQPYATQAYWTLTPGNGAKTVYARIRNGTGTVSPTVSDTIQYDGIVPSVTAFTIDAGALATTSTSIDVTLQAADPGGGSIQMAFSNDNGVTWSAWEPYASPKAWTLSPGDGPKTVQVRVRDVAGNVSAPVSDTITLDTRVGTSFGITIDNAAIWTNTTSVTLSIPAAPGTAKMMLSNDGGFPGAQWEPYDSHKAWVLDRFEGSPVTMIVYVRFGDASGTELPNSRSSDNIVLDIDPPTGSVAVAGGSSPGGAGAPTPNSPVRTVQLTATDTQSGTAMTMRLSNRADFAGAIWKPFSSSVSWDFNGGNIVYAQFKDGAGNISAVYSQTISGGIGPGQSPAPNCSPRPRISVSVQRSGGQLLVTLATTGANNGLKAVRFDSFANAIVDVGSQTNQSAPFAVSIPAGQEPTALQFTVKRQTAGAATTVRLVVIDGCGEWSTFVGGGPGAF